MRANFLALCYSADAELQAHQLMTTFTAASGRCRRKNYFRIDYDTVAVQWNTGRKSVAAQGISRHNSFTYPKRNYENFHSLNSFLPLPRPASTPLFPRKAMPRVSCFLRNARFFCQYLCACRKWFFVTLSAITLQSCLTPTETAWTKMEQRTCRKCKCGKWKVRNYYQVTRMATVHTAFAQNFQCGTRLNAKKM